MPPTDPDAPEFASIRADLARLFIVHKADLLLADWPDEAIAAHVDDIAGALVASVVGALKHGDQAWLDRHEWWRTACGRLVANQTAVPLDG